MTHPDIKALIDRVEACKGADREVDCDIFVATAESPFASYYPDCVLATLGGFSARLEIADIPRFTASLDAALGLGGRALPGLRPMLWLTEDGSWAAHYIDVTDTVFRPTPALAVTLAMLKAIQSQGEEK